MLLFLHKRLDIATFKYNYEYLSWNNQFILGVNLFEIYNKLKNEYRIKILAQTEKTYDIYILSNIILFINI